MPRPAPATNSNFSLHVEVWAMHEQSDNQFKTIG